MKYRPQWNAGFGLLELIIALAIAGLIASVAVPTYGHFVDRARTSKAIGDLGWISVEIGKFQLRNNNALPASLADLDVEVPLDPWDRPYQYLNIATAEPGIGQFRKDKNLNPLNTDFDLYSMGGDGDSKGPLSAEASRDDIVRANNGAFIGRAEEY
jgi:general secretion pathway protein G